ncbi:MAG: 4-hydroxythreonine-4-phosphate dehydrogenase PdxA [Gammaproteobacteria bacterium]
MVPTALTRPIAVTTGEPAGIGPDLAISLAAAPEAVPWVAIGDPDLLRERADQLGSPVEIDEWHAGESAQPGAGRLLVVPVGRRAATVPGRLDPANAAYVLELLDRAVEGCQAGEFTAMVTAPVHKGVINEAGVPFTGHTEYLAARTHAARTVMMLVAASLRVALVTTHLPLRAVADSITPERLETTLRVLNDDLVRRFGIARPSIRVCGLNPHAGEQGHLGREEIDVIQPVLRALRAEGLQLEGPVPADTAFTPQRLEDVDAVLAMYHDQGLPVLKYAGFGEAVNVTLGLPLIRTSVDHGTALDLAGSGRANDGSLRAALRCAHKLSHRCRT